MARTSGRQRFPAVAQHPRSRDTKVQAKYSQDGTIILRSYWARALYWDNGKENYYSILGLPLKRVEGHIGIMETKMETTI